MLKYDFLEKRAPKLILLAVSAILTGVCVCYPSLGMLEWISVIPAALVIFYLAGSERNRLRSVYLYGFFYYMCYFVTVWHWFIAMYPMEYTGMTAGTALLVVIAAVLGIPLVQTSTFAFVFVLFCKASRGKFVKRYFWLRPFIFAALWTVFEWTQTLFWFGVPWGRLALGQTELLITLQSSSLLGSYFVTFLIVSVNALIAHALMTSEARKLCTITCAAMFILNISFGAISMAVAPKPQNTVKVAAIQGNISSTEKWGLGWRGVTFESYSALTEEAAKDGAKIVVWPESVILSYDHQSRAELCQIARSNGVILMVGALHRVDGELYNSIITILSDGSISEEIYSKRHLVPFGEYVPWRGLFSAILPALTEVAMLDDDIIPGEDPGLLHTEYGTVGSLICFDSIYEVLALSSAGEGAQLIAIETNDSWFYDSPAVWMHEAQARMRAIETGRYVIRAANTGVSAIITPKGEIVDEIPPLIAGYVVSDVGFIEENTVYTIVGNLFVWMSLGFVVCVLTANTAVAIIEKKQKKA